MPLPLAEQSRVPETEAAYVPRFTSDTVLPSFDTALDSLGDTDPAGHVHFDDWGIVTSVDWNGKAIAHAVVSAQGTADDYAEMAKDRAYSDFPAEKFAAITANALALVDDVQERFAFAEKAKKELGYRLWPAIPFDPPPRERNNTPVDETPTEGGP